MNETTVHTWTGKRVDLLRPAPDQIDIRDIARSLSRLPRWNGHTHPERAYTVGQHSLAVARRMDGHRGQLEGLLHDGHEAYLGDISTPAANAIGRDIIRTIKRRLDCAIAIQFGLDFDDEDTARRIVAADEDALAAERAQFMDRTVDPRTVHPLARLRILSHGETESIFLARFHDLARH